MSLIPHPLDVDTLVEVSRPLCPCTGGGVEIVTGRIQKVINNQSGYWYYIDLNITIRSDRITKVLKYSNPKRDMRE